MTIEIQQDGLTYVITMTQPLGPAKVDRLLRQDQDGWTLKDSFQGDYYHRLGRRKTWQKALHDALVLMELDLHKEINKV